MRLVSRGILHIGMAHRYNLSAFQVGAASTQPLLRLYCALVVVELALKDSSPTWPAHGHDVPALLADAGEAALSVQLQGKLGALKCTTQKGAQAPVSAANYAHIRYLRHENDYPGTVKDSDLDAVLAVISDIMLVLRGKNML